MATRLPPQLGALYSIASSPPGPLVRLDRHSYVPDCTTPRLTLAQGGVVRSYTDWEEMLGHCCHSDRLYVLATLRGVVLHDESFQNDTD